VEANRESGRGGKRKKKNNCIWESLEEVSDKTLVKRQKKTEKRLRKNFAGEGSHVATDRKIKKSSKPVGGKHGRRGIVVSQQCRQGPAHQGREFAGNAKPIITYASNKNPGNGIRGNRVMPRKEKEQITVRRKGKKKCDEGRKGCRKRGN